MAASLRFTNKLDCIKRVHAPPRPCMLPVTSLLPVPTPIHSSAQGQHCYDSSRLVCSASKGFGAAKAPPPAKDELPIPCPCESGKTYKRCCEQAHSGKQPAKNPEKVVRARFSAIVKNQPQYLVDTTHPDFLVALYGKPAAEVMEQYKADLQRTCDQFDYDNLKIVKLEPGASDDESFVCYSYRVSKKSEAGSPERSWTTTNEKLRFLQVNGQWQVADYQQYEFNMNELLQSVEPGQAA